MFKESKTGTIIGIARYLLLRSFVIFLDEF